MDSIRFYCQVLSIRFVGEITYDLKFQVFYPEVWDRVFPEVILYDFIEFLVVVVFNAVGFGAIEVMVFIPDVVITHHVVTSFYFGHNTFFDEHIKYFVDGTEGDMREVESQVVDYIISRGVVVEVIDYLEDSSSLRGDLKFIICKNFYYGFVWHDILIVV